MIFLYLCTLDEVIKVQREFRLKSEFSLFCFFIESNNIKIIKIWQLFI